jgi:predicted XRE-type DNA-binding protein
MPRTKIAKGSKKALRADTIPRAKLAGVIQSVARKMSREDTGKVVKDAASQVSRLMNGHLDELSADRMARWLVNLGCDIEIAVRHPRERKGRVRFVYGGAS